MVAAHSVRNFKSRSGTRSIELLVPLCFRSSCQGVLRCITNFGSGALAAKLATMTADPTLPQLTIRAVRSIGVEVPMIYALGTSQARITQAPLLLIDVETEEGVTGRTYLFCYLR